VRVAVFDVDGTLVTQDPRDNGFYVDALRAVLGDVQVDTAWERYEEPTDCGVLQQVFQQCLGRSPSERETETIIGHYTKLVSELLLTEESAFPPVAGAVQFVRRLARSLEWKVVFATGSWRDAALLKLAHAGVPFLPEHLVACEGHTTRRAIIRAAISLTDYQVVGPPSQVTYFGDQLWDLEAARSLGLSFVGIGTEPTLRAMLSTTQMFHDFLEADRLLGSIVSP
jgi:phosphoglycolate phosphatase-like HAD superfamily hydrolase